MGGNRDSAGGRGFADRGADPAGAGNLSDHLRQSGWPAAIDGDTASSIREYVGGDAYNYIIGASLVGAKISGLIMTKAVYTAAGVLVICLGLICLFCGPKEPHTKKPEKIVSAPEKADETTEEVSTEEAAQKAEETNASEEKEMDAVETAESTEEEKK